MTPLTSSASTGPMRAAGRESLLALGMTDRRFGYPLEMVLRASAAGWRIGEAEVDYLPRAGRSRVTGTVRGTLRAIIGAPRHGRTGRSGMRAGRMGGVTGAHRMGSICRIPAQRGGTA
ncbi:hypothetical protein OG589_36880 [Sphaerisporangium sp. NBC_01403]|uniref:hypothetical protein n=1 Tax=Sphaerisporangium sp. NBC_01403 TaxID=2903599 RepID=UPI003252A81A